MTTTHKPVGVYNMLVVAFLAIFAIALIGFGIRDIRNGEGAGFWFFVGWLLLIGAVVFGFKRKPKDTTTTRTSASTKPPPPSGSSMLALLPMQVVIQDSTSVRTCDGMISCYPVVTVVIALVVVGLFVGILMINRKKDHDRR